MTTASTTTNSTARGREIFDGMELFILFGQSNMSGSAPIEEQDRKTVERVKFMVQYDCSFRGQSYGEWRVATPPLHGCQWASESAGLGPGDYFAKALSRAWPDAKIGLVPCAVPGVSIDFYEKGGISQGESYQALPEGYQSAYRMMLDRSRQAQALGRVRAILFHQGESDLGQEAWLAKVASVAENLRADLGLDAEHVPFIAGELPPTACCAEHNSLVRQLPGRIPNCAVASARGTTVHDDYHWDTASVRIMGQRYADEFLRLVPEP